MNYRHFIITKSMSPQFLMFSYLLYSQAFQILINAVIIFRQPRAVLPKTAYVLVRIAVRHTNHHSHSRASEKNTVCVKHIFYQLLTAFRICLLLHPLCLPVKPIEFPRTLFIAHIGVPEHARIV